MYVNYCYSMLQYVTAMSYDLPCPGDGGSQWQDRASRHDRTIGQESHDAGHASTMFEPARKRRPRFLWQQRPKEGYDRPWARTHLTSSSKLGSSGRKQAIVWRASPESAKNFKHVGRSAPKRITKSSSCTHWQGAAGDKLDPSRSKVCTWRANTCQKMHFGSRCNLLGEDHLPDEKRGWCWTCRCSLVCPRWQEVLASTFWVVKRLTEGSTDDGNVVLGSVCSTQPYIQHRSDANVASCPEARPRDTNSCRKLGSLA